MEKELDMIVLRIKNADVLDSRAILRDYLKHRCVHFVYWMEDNQMMESTKTFSECFDIWSDEVKTP